MNGKAVAYALGKLMQLTGVVLCVPLGIAVFDLEDITLKHILAAPETLGFLVTIVICFLAGTIVAFIGRNDKNDQRIKEGYAIVAFGWIVFALMGSIPLALYFIMGEGVYSLQVLFHHFTNAFFEIMSGFTTTGATILADIEGLPDSLLFWRSLTHWLGGMGIITLALAIFPAMGVSGYQMFRGEIPGPSADRLRPRLAHTAAVLWGVYALLSAAETILLLIGGMSLFDALCHTFGTMATGGFSTKAGSIGDFNSAFIDWVIIIFMYLAGVNFLLHYSLLRGKWRGSIVNREFLFYTGIIISVSILFTVILGWGGIQSPAQSYDQFRNDKPVFSEFQDHVNRESEKLDGLHDLARTAIFQVVSITTTTGYITADFDIWPHFCRIGLLVLMFLGGCAGSTGGGLKQIRVLVLIKTGWRELKRLTRPKLIAPLRVGPATWEENRVLNIASFFILFMLLFMLGSLLMTFFTPDFTTAISATAACINNIGPGLNGVGSIEHYGWIPIPGKWILIACMLLGRLEIFTVLIVFRPSFWR